MKKLVSMGLLMLILLSVFAGTTMAQENQKWGFKLNVNLKDQVQPYLKVATDELVYKFNQENNTYHINSYNSAINGNFKLADAMVRTGNGIKYDAGEYLNTNLSFYANGKFPYANNLTQILNTTFKTKNLNISAEMNILEKNIASGTIYESTPGNISKIESNSSTFMQIHLKGKNLPLSTIFYAMLLQKAQVMHNAEIDIEMNFDPAMSSPSKLCFSVNVTEKIDNTSLNTMLKISNLYVMNKNITLMVNDTNKDGYLDTGDYVCLEASPSYFEKLAQNWTDVIVMARADYFGQSTNFSLDFSPSMFGGWEGPSCSDFFYFTTINPKYANLVNETKNLPVYNNFDFTITVNLKKQTTTTFSPAVPLIRRSIQNITSHTTGTYSGTIDISGLQKPYMDILEVVLNTTFPINIAKINTHIDGFNNGTINKISTFFMLPIKIIGTMKYGDENVDIMTFKLPDTSGFLSYLKLEYFYSPTKNFIVGGSVQIGPKKFDTQATSYDDAENEINSIKNVENNGGSGTLLNKNSILLWGIIGIIAVIIIVVAVFLLRRK